MSHTISIMGFGTHSAKLSISATADTKEDARKALDDVANALNNHDRLTAEVGRLREALTDLMNSESGQPKLCGHEYTCVCPWERARKALNPEEPK